MRGKELNIYKILLGLPLFQGMSVGDMENVIGHTRFDFSHFDKAEIIIRNSAACNALWFLTSGTVSVISCSDDKSYKVEEQMQSPVMFQPEPLFGLTQRFTHNVVAKSRCDILKIEKTEVVRLMGDYDIFRTNLMNILTTRSQRLLRRPWRPLPHSLRESIVRMIADRCVYPAGGKTLYIGMQQIANIIGASRLKVSHELHSMQEDGLLTLQRQKIVIPALETLYI